jgi:adenosylcobinamide amidohydrolase
MLVWRFDPALVAISTSPLGGGIGIRNWAISAAVLMSYSRDDPDAHLAELAGGLDLDGAGLGFLTGVNVADRVVAEDSGVTVVATVGLGNLAWAAAPDENWRHVPGTVNILAFVPVRLSDAALVNATVTVTEAKAQALFELGVAATGTSTDAVAVLCRVDGPPEQYAGPRSRWGARLARAANSAVREGGSTWLRSGSSRPYPDLGQCIGRQRA